VNRRRVALAAGVLALAAGLAVAAGLTAVPVDRIVVSVVGGLALLQAVRVVARRRRTERDEATTPDPERPYAAPTPGDRLADVTKTFLPPGGSRYDRPQIREGLRNAAAAVLTRYGGYTEAEAERAVATGTWTEDREAAAFLGGDGAPTPALATRLRSLVQPGATGRGIRHTVDAIASVAGIEPRTGGEPDGRTRSPGAFTTTTGEVTEPTVRRAPHGTGAWVGVSVITLAAVGVGVLATRPAVLLAGVVGVGFAAYARTAVGLPAPSAVTVERAVADPDPDPGDEVPVTVTVTNESDDFLADLRIVDGVPAALGVADGAARLGTALRAGESTTFSYAVTARRGVHRFGPTLLVARDLAGATETELLLPAATTLECVPPLRPTAEPVPLREQATRFVGGLETSTGGPGLEFHATREYRAGDPLSRIDWNRRARTGELTTVEFREERAATVVVVVDARDDAYLGPGGVAPHAVDRGVEAAGRLYATLTAAGDRVGLAALGASDCWLDPGTGTDHGVTARRLLATHGALSPVPDDSPGAAFRWAATLRTRLPAGAQVLFVSPLADAYATRVARRLDAAGHRVTVVSPDPTADRTPGHRLARVRRALRVSELRAAGVPVVDWPAEESFDRALARYAERWDR
jgi:uncharacterized protein (DUF58 family)